ncbi:MAG: glycosyltransferase [Candidatus Bathyarchaeia archaeon]|jgi:GT2 family glycosyltransferase
MPGESLTLGAVDIPVTTLDNNSSRDGLAHQSIILTIVAAMIALAVVLKSPELSAVFFSLFTRLPQFSELYAHFDAAFIRGQAEMLQNLSGQMMAKGEWGSFDFRPRSLPFSMKLKYLFVVAATDISVIIPTLNEEKYLPNCLSSLINQSRKEFREIIVVDGGSTDQTAQVARKYSDRVLVKPGQTVGASRNIGAVAAKGEILAFIDADTIASVDWLEEISRSFHDDPGAVGVTGPTLPYGGTNLDQLAYHVATGWAQRFSLKLGLPHVAGFNCAYKKEGFWDAGGFDESKELSEDVMLSLRIRHQGRIIFNPDMMAYTSLRRIKKYGYPYLTTYYAINAAMLLLFKKNLGYPKVR